MTLPRVRIHARRWLATVAVSLALATHAAAASPTTATFEGGVPAGFFVFNGGASSVTTATAVVNEGDPLARPGQVGPNTVLTTQFTVGDFGGFGVDFAAAGSTGPQDWSGTDGFGFWFHGANSGLLYQAEILDNRSNPSADTAERFDYDFADDFVGWRYIRIPFAAFERATDFQPPGAPDDGLTLTEMWGWAVVLPASPVRARSPSTTWARSITSSTTSRPAFPRAPTGGVPIGFFTFQGASSTAAIAIAARRPRPCCRRWASRTACCSSTSTSRPSPASSTTSRTRRSRRGCPRTGAATRDSRCGSTGRAAGPISSWT